MALRSVMCCKAAIARAATIASPSSPYPYHCPAAACRAASAGAPSTLRLALQAVRCCTSSSSAPSNPTLTLQEAAPDTPVQQSQADNTETQPPASPPAVDDVDALDIRVGRIIKAWKHPEADSLYIEEVDLAEPDGPRTICSGLVKYIPEEELQGRSVMVLANLKPRNMRGIKSNGMLLAASDASHENVELLTPPDGSLPGERAWFGAETDKESQANAATPNQLQKKKVWESIQPHLKTTEECIATFKDKPMRTAAGLVTCKSLKGANIA